MSDTGYYLQRRTCSNEGRPRKHGRAPKPVVHVMVGAAAVKAKGTKRKTAYTKRGGQSLVSRAAMTAGGPAERSSSDVATGDASSGGTPTAEGNAALTVNPGALAAPLVASGSSAGVMGAVVADEGSVDTEVVGVFRVEDIEEPVETPSNLAVALYWG